jgi:hypothetical protein
MNYPGSVVHICMYGPVGVKLRPRESSIMLDQKPS